MTIRYRIEVDDSLHREIEQASEADRTSMGHVLQKSVELFLRARRAARCGDYVGIVHADQRAALKIEFSEL
ncbi:hypothetical protein CDN99_19740 [Roseateles aquatilis]|uniref:Uncharacterized protein n=1 Tax=Roseateles aquatilis TaxID=431061 RepID=A0A246J2W5_9BURK|nr:hypothetical protein [Roseateles aquatilis]OWQ86936.1 hypothetical protein CDN99_19740 [Roseateles aquatilis]